MRFSAICICFGLVLSAANPVGAELVLRADFDRAPATALEDYLPGTASDKLENVLHFQRSWEPAGPTGGWLANQFRAPNIVTPADTSPAFVWGNSLESNSNESGGTRMGYWVDLANDKILSGSFTIEATFLIRNYLPAFAEYKMQNIVSTFWMSDNKALEIRTMGEFDDRVIQLMTHDGSGEHNVSSNTGAIQDNTWYHVAAVYDHGTKNISFYLDKALVGTANTNWSDFSMKWLCVAAWPNPAGSARDMDGYLDGFAVSSDTLAPDDFVLFTAPEIPATPTPSTNVREFEIYE